MIDSFVLLAPLYLLGVIALAGFVGCAQVIGIDDWRGQPDGEAPAPGPLQPPTNVQATPGDNVVTLFWDPYPNAIIYEIDRKEAPPGMPPASYDFLDSVTPGGLSTTADGLLAYEDHTVVNGITYHYVVRASTGDGTSENSGDIEATPKSPFGPFILTFDNGSPRPGEDGWFGFSFVVTLPGVKIQKLGRFYRLSHGQPHEIKLFDAATLELLGTATVSKMSEEFGETPDGVFKYADVAEDPVELTPGNEYFILSHEAASALDDPSLPGDDFLTQDTTVTITRPEAHVINTIESKTLVDFAYTAGGADHVYGPVNFQY
jgi:hypothetical protein